MKPSKKSPSGPWRGVRTRDVTVCADPDDASGGRLATVVAGWEDGAAAALCALVPGRRPIDLEQAAEAWIRPIERRAGEAGVVTVVLVEPLVVVVETATWG